MEYFDTTPEQVASVAGEFATSRQLAHALLERGHTANDIAAMGASERFKEFCEWHGLIGWAGTLETVLQECKDITPPEPKP